MPGFTAVAVHAYLWPVLPMRYLRASIAPALPGTRRRVWDSCSTHPAQLGGAPSSLGDTVRRARDLLDDARYLPGLEPEQALRSVFSR